MFEAFARVLCDVCGLAEIEVVLEYIVGAGWLEGSLEKGLLAEGWKRVVTESAPGQMERREVCQECLKEGEGGASG